MFVHAVKLGERIVRAVRSEVCGGVSDDAGVVDKAVSQRHILRQRLDNEVDR